MHFTGKMFDILTFSRKPGNSDRTRIRAILWEGWFLFMVPVLIPSSTGARLLLGPGGRVDPMTPVAFRGQKTSETE
jgi:hypothetical protein